MAVVLAIGIVLAVVGLVLLFNVLHAGDFVIRTVTSKYLGSLPPGFAASQRGFRVYSLLLIAIGLLFAGFGAAQASVGIGILLFAVGLVGFVVLSVLALQGEAETSRQGR